LPSLRDRVIALPEHGNVEPIERQAAVPTTSLQGGLRESLNQSERGHRTAEHPEHRGAPDLIPRQHLCDLAFNEVEIIEDCGQVAAGSACNGRIGGMKE